MNQTSKTDSHNGELWGITTYFNPVGYANKIDNLCIFANRIRQQGLKLLIIELAFNDRPYIIEDSLCDQIVRLRSNTILWQKERLLNIAVEKLPDTCDKVAWLDADILFHNDDWIQETGRLLEEYPVVQPFETAWFLPPDCQDYTSDGIPDSKSGITTREGAAFMFRCGKSAGQGHPGLAWAARRSLLQAIGFYDRAIVGGADSLQMLAMFGPSGCDGLDRFLSKFTSQHHVNDMFAWATRFDSEVNRKVCYAKGRVLHLWHGNRKNRQYESRFSILKDTDFNPSVDISLDSSGCWQWNSDKSELHRRVKEYFQQRQEN
ncbi:MAG TPA: hypothetical protein VHV32_11030 [Candidatus Angelobacter sp.]|jgi:hypothetical protein|nr:hypothetical protein [Candidatus Angelobacter sp.]